MTDISHEMGFDLAWSPTGDIAAVDGTDWGRQRVLRRLLTNPGDYLWHLAYGAGLAAMVGQPANATRMGAIARAQMMQEEAVARRPMPMADVNVNPNGTVTMSIRYADGATGESQLLSVPVG